MSALPSTYRAAVLDGPGAPSSFRFEDRPLPKPEHGEVLVRIHAFGLNRSEYHSLTGQAGGMVWPRVLGLELTGEVAACPDGTFAIGTRCCAVMGGLGRQRDGGYAQYCVVPTSLIKPFRSTKLDWATLGAIPETFQTAYGSLTTGLDFKPGQTILIRGALGLFVAKLCKRKRSNLTVIATTRSMSKADSLRQAGVDHVILDDGQIAGKVREVVPNGVDIALELVGCNVLADTLRCVRVHGVCCMAGATSDEFAIKDCSPMLLVPKGVRFTSYGGGAEDLDPTALQELLDDIEAGEFEVPIDTVYPKLEDVVAAHERMASNQARGKLVVLTS